MPAFRYVAIDSAGKIIRGMMESADERDVIVRLQRQGHTPMSAEPASRMLAFTGLPKVEIGHRGLSAQDIANMTRELAIMLAAGQDLDRALRFLTETTSRARAKAVFGALRDAVRDGNSLAVAMMRHPESFSRLYVGLVRAGEAGGTLAATLERLATLLEQQRSLSATVTSAMIYPALLVIVALGSITLLLTEVLPQFVPLFEQNGAQLPRPTQILIATGDLVSTYGLYVLTAIGMLVLILRQALRQPAFRLRVDRLVLGLPIIGGLAREVLAARFSQTLGTLLQNGVPLIAALGIVRDAVGNLAGAAAIDRATISAKGGAGLSSPLAEAGIFPLRTIYLLRLGEETAQLGGMALRAAEIHQEKTRIGVQRLVSMLVPFITILMGAAVAGIVSSLLLAMLSLNDLAN
jgi:general secretion pathway protein F